MNQFGQEKKKKKIDYRFFFGDNLANFFILAIYIQN